MKKEELIQKAYEIAVERYAAVGVDTEQVLKTMQDFHLSLHCWQADDVAGFEVQAGSLTGGIQATGNYPGKARNIDELRADILKAASYIPGTHRLNLHEIYGDFQRKVVDRDQVEPEHFKSWIEWGKEHNMKLDFNSTSFSHPKSGDLSLSNPDEGIRQFWIEHTKRCRAVAEEMGKAQGDPCIMNLWVHDGSKDITVNRMKYRALLKDSLDQIFATGYKNMKDCIESKVFGIGLESYTVGSNDFYIGYGASHNKMITLDTGHFHPTESVADKVSSLLLYVPELMLHVSRPVRWDSDHVTIMDDPTMELFSEIVRCGALDRVHYGLDYFDASINRIGAYVIGSRAAQKCMTRALLEPIAKLREYEANGQGFQRLALLEEEKLGKQMMGEENSTQEKGRISSQDIPAGTKVEQYTTLKYYLSKGQQEVVMPDLSGETGIDAQQTLEDLGLNVTVQKEYSEDDGTGYPMVNPGYVDSVTPAAGSSVSAGDEVTLVVSRGLDYGDSVSVPSVVGMTKNDAITTLGKWTDIKVTEQQSSDVASGEVISQNPAADETADPDQPIEIVVSSGNEAPASDTEDTSATDNTASAQSTDSTQQSAAAANGEVWKCTQTLNTPTGYQGGQVRLELLQDVNGETQSSIIVDCKQITFPYTLDVTGAPGVSEGTLYVSEVVDGTIQQLGQYPLTFKKAE